MNLNKAFILGNVTRDPEARSMPNGGQVTSFGLATNRFYTDASGQKQQDVEFHNVVCFGKLADISSRYLNKGSLVLIEGRIKTRNWQNAQGIKQYRTEIVAENMQLGPKSMSQTGGGGNYANYKKRFSGQTPEPEMPNPPAGGEIPIIEENYTPPAGETPKAESVSFEPDAAEEIDIKDIPF